jgi:site-specific recombinase XerD
MKSLPKLIGPLLQAFFMEYLLQQRHVSPQTIASYRDAFRLLLQFVHKKLRIEPALLSVAAVDAPVILSFLDSLEADRHNCVRSRNIRLAAIRSFFRWLTLRDPELVGLATQILAIPVKRTDRRLIQPFTREEMEALLAAPDKNRWIGRRDHALLLTLYNTGARVSEMTALRRDQVTFGRSTFVHLLGKGRKERDVPVWTNTARVLQTWFQELEGTANYLAFPSARGRRLSRNGVDHILKQAVARAKCPTLCHKRIHPHAVRHTTGAHLLQSGVDISVIALWLGHESIETTHIYVEADLAAKERALQHLAPIGGKGARARPPDRVLAFLQTL